MQQQLAISDSTEIARFMHLTSSDSLETMPEDSSIDPRICCFVYYDADSLIYTVSFSGETTGMEIDSTVFKTIPQLLQLVVNYLPKGYLEN